MKICTFCNESITEEQIKSGEAYILFGVWSHTACDNKKLADIDKKIKVIKNQDMI